MPERDRAGIAAIGETARIEGYALAGVLALPAEDAAAVRRAWQGLPGAIGIVILTPSAAEALRPDLGAGGSGGSEERLTVVLPA